MIEILQRLFRGFGSSPSNFITKDEEVQGPEMCGLCVLYHHAGRNVDLYLHHKYDHGREVFARDYILQSQEGQSRQI